MICSDLLLYPIQILCLKSETVHDLSKQLLTKVAVPAPPQGRQPANNTRLLQLCILSTVTWRPHTTQRSATIHTGWQQVAASSGTWTRHAAGSQLQHHSCDVLPQVHMHVHNGYAMEPCILDEVTQPQVHM